MAVPEAIPIISNADGSARAIVIVRYRLLQPTVQLRDGLTLPRGVEALQRLADIRGWVLSTLPAGNPLRDQILAEVAKARAPFRVKQVVTPAGTEVDASIALTLRASGSDWQAAESDIDPVVPGSKDADPSIPFEDSREAAARLGELEASAQRLEELRRGYLADRARIAAEALAKLRVQLRTGHTFEGRLADGTPVRLVVTRGLDEDETATTAVLTTRGTEESSARYTGRLEQQPSGETVWRASRVVSLSAPTTSPSPAATSEQAHPVLTLSAGNGELAGRIEVAGRRGELLQLRPGEPVDLIPEG